MKRIKTFQVRFECQNLGASKAYPLALLVNFHMPFYFLYIVGSFSLFWEVNNCKLSFLNLVHHYNEAVSFRVSLVMPQRHGGGFWHRNEDVWWFKLPIKFFVMNTTFIFLYLASFLLPWKLNNRHNVLLALRD